MNDDQVKEAVGWTPERKRLYSAEWRKNNPDRIKQYAENQKIYWKNNRAKRTRQFQNLKVGGQLDAVLKKYKNLCCFCKQNVLTLGKGKMAIHHKDGLGYKNIKNKANNKLSNLVLLCCRCHMKFHYLATCLRKEQTHALSAKSGKGFMAAKTP